MVNPKGMQRDVILKEFGIPESILLNYEFPLSSDGPYKYYVCNFVMYVVNSSFRMYSEIC